MALRKTTGTFSWLERREQDCCRIRDSDEFTEEEGWAGRPPWRCGGWRQDSSREVPTWTTMLGFSSLNNLKSETSDIWHAQWRDKVPPGPVCTQGEGKAGRLPTLGDFVHDNIKESNLRVRNTCKTAKQEDRPTDSTWKPEEKGKTLLPRSKLADFNEHLMAGKCSSSCSCF